MARIALEDLKRSYDGSTYVIDGLSLTIENGSFLVLMGANGSGKTTLLRMIAGLDRPDEGTIRFDEKDVTREEPLKRGSAMVFQNYSLYPDRNVYRNIAFPLESLHVPQEEMDVKVRGIAERLGLTPLLNRRPASLSGGEKQRTAIARALVRDPSVLLLDEPFSNLDESMRRTLLYDLLDLQQEKGLTIVYVTHDEKEAKAVADQVVTLKDGAVDEVWQPEVAARARLGRPAAEEASPQAKRGFFRILFEELFPLMGLNLLFCLFGIGIVTIPASLTALCGVCLKMERDEPVKPARDFLTYWKRDFLRSSGGGAVLSVLLALFWYVSYLYSQMSVGRTYLIVLGIVTMLLFLCVLLTAFYFFPMMALIDLPVLVLLRNSFVIAVLEWKRSFLYLAVFLVFGVLIGAGLWPYSLIYLLLLAFSLLALAGTYLTGPVIFRRVAKPEE